MSRASLGLAVSRLDIGEGDPVRVDFGLPAFHGPALRYRPSIIDLGFDLRPCLLRLSAEITSDNLATAVVYASHKK